MKSVAIKTSAFALALILCFCPLSACFASSLDPDEWQPATTWYDSGCYMFWLLLRMMGYNIGVDDVYVWSDATYNLVSSLVYEFLDELPSPVSLMYWISPWAWGSDFWGNFKFNSSMLEDAETFARWLQQKYNITSNSTHILDSTWTVEDYPLYQFGTEYQCYNVDMTVSAAYFSIEMVNHQNVADLIGYSACVISGKGALVLVSSSYNASSFAIRKKLTNWSGEVSNTTLSRINVTDAADNYWYHITTEYFWTNQLPPGEWPTFANLNAAKEFYNDTEIESSGSELVITSDIAYPTDDPNYTTGDGVVIIENEPSYQVVDVNNPITVGNLPAVIAVKAVSDPGFNNAYQPIKVFVNTFSDSMTIVKDIAFRLPSCVWVIFYAVMSITVIFGAIHLFKEH